MLLPVSVPDAEAAIQGLEVGPQAMATAGYLADRVSAKGGAALLIDYGRNRPYPASLQAIKQHKFSGLLEQPGLADLSAHVDFGAIRYVIELWSCCFLALHRSPDALLSAYYSEVPIGSGHISRCSYRQKRAKLLLASQKGYG